MKLTKEKLYGAIKDEWADMHHNASINSHYPDLKNDYESELFWNVLNDEVSEFYIPDLQEQVQTKYGYKWKFYSYGRQGATIAPDNIMRFAPCNDFGGIKEEAIPEDYNDMYNLLHALQYINQYWKSAVRGLPKWWEEMKKANNYQEDIDAHENMHAVMRQVWIADK